MKHVSVRQAIKFGFRPFVKGPLSFFAVLCVCWIICSLGMFIGSLIFYGFFKPNMKQIYSLMVHKAHFSLEYVENIVAYFWNNIWSFNFFLGFFITALVAKLVYDFLVLGWSSVSLTFYDKNRIFIADFFSRPSIFFRYTVFGVIFTFILFGLFKVFFLTFIYLVYMLPIERMLSRNVTTLIVGLLSSIPSLYLALKLWFVPFIMVDKNVGIIDSLRMSYKISGITKKLTSLLFIFFVIISSFYLLASLLFSQFVSGILFSILISLMWYVMMFSSAFLYRKFVS